VDPSARHTSLSSSTDEALLTLLRGGSKDAFTELYNRYHEPVFRYIAGSVKIPQLAEDLVHEVFMKLWDRKDRLEIRDNFAGYLFRVCHNLVADTLKKIAGERALKDQLIHQYQYLSSEHYSEEELQQLDGLVEEALQSLSPQQRVVYELCKKQGKSYLEVATELNISANTVKEHMSKSLFKLREFLRDKGKLGLFFILFEKFF
jgi:RNA polymerase sigma-70 factor (family 1)